MFDEPRSGLHAIAYRGPDEGSSAIGIGIEPCASSNETREGFGAAGFRGPDKSFVEDFLRIGRGLPVGESAVRPVEAACRTSLGGQGESAAEALFQKLEIAETGSHTQISGRKRILAQQISRLSMTPEERDDERGASGAMRFRVEVGFTRDQCGGSHWLE